MARVMVSLVVLPWPVHSLHSSAIKTLQKSSLANPGEKEVNPARELLEKEKVALAIPMITREIR